MNETKKSEVLITRVFAAPKEVVWRAWTDPEYVRRWWGPKEFTAPYANIDLRVGGSYLYCKRSPDGKEYWSTGKYKEITPNERIVATDSFSDSAGNIIPAAFYGMKGIWPKELVVTVTFEEQDGQTKLTLRHSGFPTDGDAAMTREGWSTSLDKLADELAFAAVE